MAMYLSSTVNRATLVGVERRTLGDFIRQRREQLGLKQKDLGDLVGVKQAYISQIETGGTKWPQHLVPALAKALGVTQAELAERAGLIQLEDDERPERADDPLYDVMMLGAKSLTPEGRKIILKIMESLKDDYSAD